MAGGEEGGKRGCEGGGEGGGKAKIDFRLEDVNVVIGTIIRWQSERLPGDL